MALCLLVFPHDEACWSVGLGRCVWLTFQASSLMTNINGSAVI